MAVTAEGLSSAVSTVANRGGNLAAFRFLSKERRNEVFGSLAYTNTRVPNL